MATFPRTVTPKTASGLWLPQAMHEIAHAGMIQIRATTAVGWSWRETMPLLSMRNADHMALYAFIMEWGNRGKIHDMTHPQMPGSGIAPNGVTTGTVRVDGGGQTGDTITVDGYPTSTSSCAVAGDIIQIENDNARYMVAANADSNGSGEVDIPVVPNVRTAPADNALITRAGVQFRVALVARSKFEPTRSPLYIADLSIQVQEAIL